MSQPFPVVRINCPPVDSPSPRSSSVEVDTENELIDFQAGVLSQHADDFSEQENISTCRAPPLATTLDSVRSTDSLSDDVDYVGDSASDGDVEDFDNHVHAALRWSPPSSPEVSSRCTSVATCERSTDSLASNRSCHTFTPPTEPKLHDTRPHSVYLPSNPDALTLQYPRSDDDYALRSDVLDDSHEIPQVWAPPVDEVSRRYTRSSAVDMSNGGEQGMWHGSVATFSDQYGSDERRHRAYNQICDAHDTADSDNVLRGHDDNTELHEKPIPVASGRIVPLSLRRGDPTHSSIIPLILHSGRRHGIDSTAPNGASAYACLVPVPPLLRLSAPQRLQPSSARRRLMLCLPPSTFSARQQRNASIKGTESFNRPMPLNNTTDSREHLFPNGENVPCPDPAGIVSSSPTLRGRAYPPAGAPPVCTAPVATAAHERNAVPDSPSNIATTPEGTAEPSPASVSQGHLSRLRRNWIAIAERFDAHHRATHEHSNAERRTQLVGTHSWRTARAPPDAAVTTGATPTAPPPETAVTASPAPVEPWGDNRTLPACSGGAEATCTREHVAIRSDTGGNTPRTTTHTPAPAVTWQSPAPRQHVAERAPADRRALLPHDNAYSQPLPAALVDVLLTDIRYPCERTLVCDIGDNHGAAFASSATGQTLLAH